MCNDLKPPRILMICGRSQTVINFRFGLIEACRKNGYEVSVIALDDEQAVEIEHRGVKFYSVNSENRSLNPLKMLRLMKKYLHIIKNVQPDIVFTFMLKPNIFGVRAAKKAGVKKIFSMVEGAGDVFVGQGLKWKLIRAVVCKMLRKSFRYVQKVFFLNRDDKTEFINRKLMKAEQCKVIPGIGVNLEHFAQKPIKNYNTFLMIARMMNTKGVLEYCKAARIVKRKYPDAVFRYLGAEGTIKISDIKEYIDDGSIEYSGTTADVRPYLEDCAVCVLPSYREGLPVSVIEAEAVGRAVITSDVPGCRDTVNDTENGFIIPKEDFEELAEKCVWCIEHPQEVEQMGEKSRKFTEVKFDENIINRQLIEEIQ